MSEKDTYLYLQQHDKQSKHNESNKDIERDIDTLELDTLELDTLEQDTSELIEIEDSYKILNDEDLKSILESAKTTKDNILKYLFNCVKFGKSEEFRRYIKKQKDKGYTDTEINKIINTSYKNTYILHYACKKGRDKIVTFLLFLSAKCFTADNIGLFPQHYAAQSNNPELIDILCVFGIDLNMRDRYGNTPLHYAVVTNSCNSAKILMKYRVNPHIKNNKGQKAIEITNKNNTYGLLLKYMKKFDNIL